jgi:hypothetical protein
MGTGRWPPYNEGMGHWKCQMVEARQGVPNFFSLTPPPWWDLGAHLLPGFARYKYMGAHAVFTVPSQAPAPLRPKSCRTGAIAVTERRGASF